MFHSKLKIYISFFFNEEIYCAYFIPPLEESITTVSFLLNPPYRTFMASAIFLVSSTYFRKLFVAKGNYDEYSCKYSRYIICIQSTRLFLHIPMVKNVTFQYNS